MNRSKLKWDFNLLKLKYTWDEDLSIEYLLNKRVNYALFIDDEKERQFFIVRVYMRFPESSRN